MKTNCWFCKSNFHDHTTVQNSYAISLLAQQCVFTVHRNILWYCNVNIHIDLFYAYSYDFHPNPFFPSSVQSVQNLGMRKCQLYLIFLWINIIKKRIPISVLYEGALYLHVGSHQVAPRCACFKSSESTRKRNWLVIYLCPDKLCFTDTTTTSDHISHRAPINGRERDKVSANERSYYIAERLQLDYSRWTVLFVWSSDSSSAATASFQAASQPCVLNACEFPLISHHLLFSVCCWQNPNQCQ